MMLAAVNVHLEAKAVATRTTVNATMIHAPSSTMTANRKRDPEMYQPAKGNLWNLAIKALFEVDAKEGMVHPVLTTAANLTDSRVLPDLLHG